MIFVDQNKIVPGGIFIKGKFIDPKFNSTIFQQELAQASELSNRLSFNHTDGHDGRGPMLAKMRDWWGLNARKAQSFVITYNTGDVEPMQKIPMNKQSRYILHRLATRSVVVLQRSDLHWMENRHSLTF